MHEVLISCGGFEKEFVKSLEGGRGGGETIRVIFEDKLVNSLRSLNLREFYGAEFVKSVVDATDGYQPHLVAPELGIRRLIELGLARLRDPRRSASEPSTGCSVPWWSARWRTARAGGRGRRPRGLRPAGALRRLSTRLRAGDKSADESSDNKAASAIGFEGSVASSRGGAGGVRRARRASRRVGTHGRRPRGHGGVVLRRRLFPRVHPRGAPSEA